MAGQDEAPTLPLSCGHSKQGATSPSSCKCCIQPCPGGKSPLVSLPAVAESPSPLPLLAPARGSARSLLACKVLRKQKPESDVQLGSARHRLASSDTALSQRISRTKSCFPRVTPGVGGVSPTSLLCAAGNAMHPSSTAVRRHASPRASHACCPGRPKLG